MPKLSIITVNLNNRSGLLKTIESVKNQRFRDFEFIVIDGGSTDGSKEELENNTGEIDYWISEKDHGVYHAMNKGISKAHGDYCLFLNSGDRLTDDQVLRSVFNVNPSADIIYGNVIREKSDRKRKLLTYPDKLTLYDFYKATAAIHHQATFIKRKLFVYCGIYREDLKLIGDWEFFFRSIILNNCTTYHVDLVISDVDARGMSHNYSMNDPAIIRDIDIRNEVFRDHFPEYILKDYEWFRKLDLNQNSLSIRFRNYFQIFIKKRNILKIL